MPYRFSYGTNAYIRTSLSDALARIAGLGFDGCEILADHPHALPPAARATEIAAELRRLGLAAANINGNTSRGLDRPSTDPQETGPTLIDADPARRARRREHALGCLALARACGAAQMSLTSGLPPPGDSDAVLWARWSAEMGTLLAAARAAGVRIGIEYEPGFWIGSAERAREAIERAGDERLGVNFDVGHAVVAGEDPAAWIQRFGASVFHVHVEDIRGRVHVHLVPGEGEIDFAAIRRALEDIRYDGFLTLELYTCADRPDEAGRKGLAELRRQFS